MTIDLSNFNMIKAFKNIDDPRSFIEFISLIIAMTGLILSFIMVAVLFIKMSGTWEDVRFLIVMSLTWMIPVYILNTIDDE